MSDTIIMFENGKAVGGEGHPINADEITFNNEDTGLVSEEVESAIKEVNAKFDKGSVSVTADGVKTYGALFNELYALIDPLKVSNNSVIKYNNNFYRLDNSTSTRLIFHTSRIHSAYMAFEEFRLESSLSAYWTATVATSAVTVINKTDDVVTTSGAVIELFY